MSVPEGKRAKSKLAFHTKAADECYESWKAHAQKGNTYRLLQRMDEYYESLWKE